MNYKIILTGVGVEELWSNMLSQHFKLIHNTGQYWTSWSGPRILEKHLRANQPFRIWQLRWIALWIAFLTTTHWSMSIFPGAQSVWWRHSREPCRFTTGLNSRFPHFLTLFCRQYECFRANAQELCMSRRWPPPTYDLSHEEGNLKISQFVGSVPFGIFSFRFASWEKFHYKMHYWGEAHRGIIVTGHDLVIFFQTR